MRSLENSSATLVYQLNDKVAMTITANVSNTGEGDGGMVDAKIVATNSAALGLDRLPNSPRRQAENNERRAASGNGVWPMLVAERLNNFSPR